MFRSCGTGLQSCASVVLRPRVRVVTDSLRQAGSNRIRHDVVGHSLRRFLASQDPFEVPGLPQRPAVLPRVPESRCLFPSPNHVAQTGLLVPCLKEQMYVIWHEAVRKHCETVLFRRVQELPSGGSDRLLIRERRMPPERAGSHVITRCAAVGEALKSCWTWLVHARFSASGVPAPETSCC